MEPPLIEFDRHHLNLKAPAGYHYKFREYPSGKSFFGLLQSFDILDGGVVCMQIYSPEGEVTYKVPTYVVNGSTSNSYKSVVLPEVTVEYFSPEPGWYWSRTMATVCLIYRRAKRFFTVGLDNKYNLYRLNPLRKTIMASDSYLDVLFSKPVGYTDIELFRRSLSSGVGPISNKLHLINEELKYLETSIGFLKDGKLNVPNIAVSAVRAEVGDLCQINGF